MHDRLILFPMTPGQTEIPTTQGGIVLRQKHYQGIVWNLVRHPRVLDKILVEFSVQRDIFISETLLVYFFSRPISVPKRQ